VKEIQTVVHKVEARDSVVRASIISFNNEYISTFNNQYELLARLGVRTGRGIFAGQALAAGGRRP